MRGYKATCFTCSGTGKVMMYSKEEHCFKCRGKGYFDIPKEPPATILKRITRG